MDKERVFEVLNDWNYWGKEVPVFFDRDYYEKSIVQLDLTDEVSVLKGIRRCGKSTLLINHIKGLVKGGIEKKKILFVNFEDPRLGLDLTPKELDEIFNIYKEYVYEGDEVYLFLDEIQNVSRWEKWIRTMYELRKVKKIYVTGSSSKLLSREFGTALSGRYLDLQIFPLSFKEYLNFNGISKVDLKSVLKSRIRYKKLFNQYLKDGGFPKVVLSEDSLKRKEVLNYFETIILKDVVARYGLKNYDNVKKVAIYLISNIGKQINLNKIRVALGLSYELVEKYYEYLKDTFLVYDVNKYDYSIKKQYSSNKKVYVSDLSFANDVAFSFSQDKGRLLENLVYLQLLRLGKEIYYFNEDYECDFVVKGGKKIDAVIQVCHKLTNAETKKREIRGLVKAMESNKLKYGLILTNDESEQVQIDGFKIEIKPVWRWLLEVENEI